MRSISSSGVAAHAHVGEGHSLVVKREEEEEKRR